jgi:hypothetical protein
MVAAPFYQADSIQTMPDPILLELPIYISYLSGYAGLIMVQYIMITDS